MDKMDRGARRMDLEVLRQVLSGKHGDSEEISTEKTGDAFLHMFLT